MLGSLANKTAFFSELYKGEIHLGMCGSRDDDDDDDDGCRRMKIPPNETAEPHSWKSSVH